jgi:hypothetical protein
VQKPKISLHFSRVSSPHPSAAKRKKKWKGNFWFCFAVSVSEKSIIILSFLFALFSALTATEAQYNTVCAKAQANLYVLAPPALCAHKSPPFLGEIIKRRGLLPSILVYAFQ